MNLFLWTSEVLKQYSNGDIIVMAENVDEARQTFSEKMEHNLSLMRASKTTDDITYHKGFEALESVAYSFYGCDDEEIEEEIEFIRNKFMNEISQPPTILDDTYLILGSS